jgi:hypothetical protein
VQLVGALFIFCLNVFMTSVIFAFIKYVLRVKLRYPNDILEKGDDEIHDEMAYAFEDDIDSEDENGAIQPPNSVVNGVSPAALQEK